MLDSSLLVFSQQQGDITHISDSMPSQTTEPLELPSEVEPRHGREESVSSPMDLESEGEDEEEKEEEKIELEDDGVTFFQPTIISNEKSMEFMVSAFQIALIVR